MTIKELSALVDLCLEKRIRQLKMGDTDIYFDDVAFMDMGSGVIPGPKDPINEMPSDDELLNWSTPITMVEDPKQN